MTAEILYGADDLTHLEGLDAVRKRPGMYIGSTDSRGVNHLANEIIDNATDEGVGGHATRVAVTLHGLDPLRHAGLGGAAGQRGERVRAGVDDRDRVSRLGQRHREAAGATAHVHDGELPARVPGEFAA